MDRASLSPDVTEGQQHADEFRTYLEEIDAELAAPRVLAEVDEHDYDAVVLPGGHGPMADLVHDPSLGRILASSDRAGRLIAPFCHGPAALLSATLADGSNAFAGRRLTVFTDEEERTGGTGQNTPWWVESALRDAGAVVEHVFVVFNYGIFKDTPKFFESIGVELHGLATWWDVLEVCKAGNHFDPQTLDEVEKFLHDPVSWSAAHGGIDKMPTD